jgi:hypothetical protein
MRNQAIFQEFAKKLNGRTVTDTLLDEITALRDQVDKLTKERDEAVAAMTPRELPKSAVPHAYMLEETARYATYWESGARTEPDRGLALICLHQAVNGWKNAAYSMAEKRMQAEHQLAALASQNEKMRDALENHSGNYKLTRAECAAINAILSLPDLATPALNRIKAEGMRMAINWFDGRYPFSNLNGIRDLAAELDATQIEVKE